MDAFFSPLLGGLGLLLNPWLVVLLLLGTLWGTAAGAMPGVGPNLAMGVMIPVTFVMTPIEAVAFLVAINVGVSYGNSIPAVLLALPGTPSAVFTAIEGHALHKRGESGLALGTTFFASVVGQLLSAGFFIVMVVPLAQLTYLFHAPELFALHLLGMTAIVSLAGKNVLKGMVAVALGLFVTMIGRDPVNLIPRFTLGISELRIGLDPVPVVLGLLAASELIRSFRQAYTWESLAPDFSAKFPSWQQLKRSRLAIAGGTAIGSVVGAIPGVGGTAAAAMAYQQAKVWSRHPEEFGRGSVEGIAANEAAQNASQAGEMVPTFGFGIPGSSTMVLLLAAVSIHGLVPGPLLVRESPQMLDAAVAGLLGSILFLAVIGWPIAQLLLRMVRLDRAVVLVVAFAMTIVGTYALRQSWFDVLIMLVFGFVGYFMLRYGYSTAAAAIAVVLGGGLEANLRQGLSLTRSDPLEFISRPITAIILALVVALLIYGIRATLMLAQRERTEAGP